MSNEEFQEIKRRAEVVFKGGWHGNSNMALWVANDMRALIATVEWLASETVRLTAELAGAKEATAGEQMVRDARVERDGVLLELGQARANLGLALHACRDAYHAFGADIERGLYVVPTPENRQVAARLYEVVRDVTGKE